MQQDTGEEFAEIVRRSRDDGFMVPTPSEQLSAACVQVLALAEAGIEVDPHAVAVAQLTVARREAEAADYPAAVELARRALASGAMAPDDIDTLTARHHVAYWLGESGRIDDGIVAFRALLVDRLRVLGPDHPDTLLTRNSLAWWLVTAGQIDEATDQCRAALESRLRSLGPDHPDTRDARHNLDWCLARATR